MTVEFKIRTPRLKIQLRIVKTILFLANMQVLAFKNNSNVLPCVLQKSSLWERQLLIATKILKVI